MSELLPFQVHTYLSSWIAFCTLLYSKSKKIGLAELAIFASNCKFYHLKLNTYFVSIFSGEWFIWGNERKYFPNNSRPKGFYVGSYQFHLAVESRDLFSKWKTDQLSFCEFTPLLTTVIFSSAWDKSPDSAAKWSRLDQI